MIQRKRERDGASHGDPRKDRRPDVRGIHEADHIIGVFANGLPAVPFRLSVTGQVGRVDGLAA